MGNIFQFGETVAGYDIPVLNEREVRASAGILFFFALVSFMNAWLTGDFRLTQIFVVAFLIDFTIRIFVNPKFAPSLILGRFAVSNQAPEWVGAPQKRFAWAVGLGLAVLMFYLIVLNRVIGPVNLMVCATCLTLLFFESAFGICLACKIFNLAFRGQAQHCPGGVCDVVNTDESQKLGAVHVLIVVGFLATNFYVADRFFPPSESQASVSANPPKVTVNDDKCTPPDWAVAMGHSEKWKLHNNCM